MAIPRWLIANAMDIMSALTVNTNDVKVVRWTCERYLSSDSLGKIAVDLEWQSTLSPTSKTP